ncbi:MAG: mechanosensitive ion channel [Candidatus Aminicenantes bacterium]|nr:mechanosensitive ion channel [Candidatus Aminicenantes bacterium]
MDYAAMLKALKDWFLSSGITIVLILIALLVVLRIVKSFSKRLSKLFLKKKEDEESRKRADTISSVIRNTLRITVVVLALLIILSQVGIEIGPLLAAAGIAGLAIGFAGQSLVKDILNGFFILLEDQIRVGDIVEVGGISGVVEKINLKLTRLRDLEGNVHFIPNSIIDIVSNKTKEYSCYLLDIGVAYREDADEVMEVIKDIDKEMREDPNWKEQILQPVEIFGLDRFDDSAVVVRARTRTLPAKQWGVGREFKRRIKKRFDELDIEIPFPHTTLYMGQDKDKSSPPLNVQMEKTRPSQ